MATVSFESLWSQVSDQWLTCYPAQEDITFCGQHCGVDPYEVYHYFPNAASWTVKIYPETAHLILFHNTAPDLMNDTLKFLEAAGL